MKLYTGHDEWSRTDFLLTVHDDGSHTIATRPGDDEHWTRWSPPVPLMPESAEVSS